MNFASGTTLPLPYSIIILTQIYLSPALLLCGDVGMWGTATLPKIILGVQTGIHARTGARPARRNILDLRKDLPAWSLYIQALLAMQQTPENDLLSWFQIAGIHGRPYISWDNIEWNPSAPEEDYALTPTIPDVVNFPIVFIQTPSGQENVSNPLLYKFQQFPPNENLFPAGQSGEGCLTTYNTTVRFPVNGVPNYVVNFPIVFIQTPSGQENVSNPLLYKFQQFPPNENLFPAGQSGEGCLTTYNTTVRFPVNGVPNCESINANLGGSNLKENTSIRLSLLWHLGAVSDFIIIVLTVLGLPIPQLQQDGNRFLVHANTDRLFALWQAMNPNSFLTPEINSVSTFTNAVRANLTVNTPLTPFMKVDGTAWTSARVRELVGLGYSYSEIMDWLPNSNDELAKNVTAVVNRTYGPAAK
ncbi:uncharacterized protein PAC_11429 [Phialocephala subalpina]|uniref:Uncharacterized protein n=1 Tax=Phialocephala subalpina TaxID=576137 RepID=A0A1L7X941_9HELO|nr:uncharacterized protein PAC_11429 [Phialocephala subalpina]